MILRPCRRHVVVFKKNNNGIAMKMDLLPGKCKKKTNVRRLSVTKKIHGFSDLALT